MGDFTDRLRGIHIRRVRRGQPADLDSSGRNFRSGERSLLLVTTVAATYDAFLGPIAARMASQGWRVELMTGGGDVVDALGALSDVHRVGWRRALARPGTLQAVAEARRIITSRDFDLVHVHTPIAATVTRLANRTIPQQERPLLIYTAHGFHFHPGRSAAGNLPYLVVEKLAGPLTDTLVVINAEDFEAAKRHRIVAVDRLVRHHGIGVDLEHYVVEDNLLLAGAQLRRSLDIVAEAPLFAMVAELNPGKRADLAVGALAGSGLDNGHLVLAGEGPLRGEIENLARKLGVAERVHLLGHLADPRALMATATAVVLPSMREGLSRCVMEAQALGVPVIGSNIRGIAELVGPQDGTLVPVGHADAIAKAMVHWAKAGYDEGRVRRSRLRLAPYSSAVVVANHNELYHRLIDSRRVAVTTAAR